jgi:hypothetical protein
MIQNLLLILMAIGVAAPSVANAEDRTICVYDPAGRTGFAFGWLESWKIAAASWGTNITLKPYTDEETAINDFDAGACDGLSATGIRLQKYNRATYSVEAIAGIPDYTLLKRIVVALQTRENYQSLFTAGNYQTVGIYPLGAVYAFVRDRNIDDTGDMAGKRIGAMEYDQTSLLVVDRIGGVTVPMNLSNLSSTFNNGAVDVTFAPASAYQPFELWHGLEKGGGIIWYPLLQVTMQIVLKNDKFPAGFGVASRKFVAGQYDAAFKIVSDAEAAIPAKYWMDMPTEGIDAFERLNQRLRIELRDKNRYDGKVLSLLRKARCNADSTRWECVEELE